MNEVNVNMRITEAEKSVESMILQKIDRSDAVLKIIEIQGESRYFPLRQYWHEALTLGVLALKRNEQFQAVADEVCENVCRWREKALEENKDPDDAQRWLEQNYCNSGCPIMRLQ